MVKNIKQLMGPAANIDMPKPEREDIERQIAASHQAIRNAIEYHNTKGEAIDEKTSRQISDEVGFHGKKIHHLQSLLDGMK